MATQTLFLLSNGDKNVTEYYSNAIVIWKEIKVHSAFSSVVSLSKELADRQSEFESNCGGRYLGREIMPTVGVGQFYTQEIGFEDSENDVIKVVNALFAGCCSAEVKLWTVKICRIFHLERLIPIDYL